MPTEPWEEPIGENTSVLWTCRDPRTRRVIRVVTRTPLLKKQKAAGIPKAYRTARLGIWDEPKSNRYASDVVRSYLHRPDHSLFLSPLSLPSHCLVIYR